jgi:hypothetical protein
LGDWERNKLVGKEDDSERSGDWENKNEIEKGRKVWK